MGAPQRFPYGQALGFQNQFNFTVGPTIAGTMGNISGTTTPNVTLGGLFYVNNTGSLTITSFLLDDTANRLTQYEGKVIRIMALDTGSTTISGVGVSNTNIVLQQNGVLELMFSRGSWFSTDYVGAYDSTTFVTNVGSSLNMNGVRVAFLSNTGSTTNKIIGLSGGQVGQEVTFMNVGSNPIIFIGGVGVGTTSNMIMVGTNSLLVDASGAYKFIKHSDGGWRGLVVGSASWAT